MTAQETFAAMLRDEVAPALRKLGLKGSGQRYELPSDEFWATVGFQKLKWSDAAKVTFTINLTVASRRGWAEARAVHPYLPERPSPTLTFYIAPGVDMDKWVWQSRIGLLLSEKNDRWWDVTPGQDIRPLAAEIVGAIRDYGLTAMRARMESGEPLTRR
jgi:hypothetical protein